MRERFFSTVGYALSDRRCGFLTSILESQLFLSINKWFWNIKDLYTVTDNSCVADNGGDESSITTDDAEDGLQGDFHGGN